MLGTDVHDLIANKVVDFCVSDIVREKKHAVTIVQQVYSTDGRPAYKQIITSTPIFDAFGEIQYFFTEIANISELNQLYQQALLQEKIQSLTVSTSLREKGKEKIIYQSPVMENLLTLANKICNVDLPVLLFGESGTGKEVLAQYIHKQSNRGQKEMIVINCASLPENLLEAELFGYERGAYTGASQKGKKGLIEEADGSTLFLDEINSLPLSIQGKLLRVLETKEVRRLGSNKTKVVDFHLLTATNENLYQLAEKGAFRMDLYYRLNVIPLTIPPLRQRKEDIIPLAVHFLQRYCEKYGKIKTFSQEVLQTLTQYDWPGNVRELKNFVERIIAMSADDVLTVQQLPKSLMPASYAGGLVTFDGMEDSSLFQEPDKNVPQIDFTKEGFSLKEYLAQKEKEVLEIVLKELGSTYKASQFLGVDQSTIARKK